MGPQSLRSGIAILVLWALTVFPGSAAPLDEWEGHYVVYLSVEGHEPIPVGSEERRYYPAELDGRTVQAYQSSARMHLNLMGTTVTVVEDALSYSSPDGDPLRLEVGMGSGESGAQKVVATYYPDRVEYVRQSGADESAGVVEIPEGISLRDPEYLYDPATMPVGETVTLYAFEPMSLSIQSMAITNMGAEVIEVAGGVAQAWRLEVDSEALGPTTHWVDDEGYVWRSSYTVGALEFSVERVSAEMVESVGAADRRASRDLPDLIAGTAVRPGLDVPNPRECRELTVRITGIDRERLLVEDRRQAYSIVSETDGGELEATLTVKAMGPPRERPAIGQGLPEEVRGFLEPTATIQSQDPRFIALGEELTRGESDPWAVAWGIAEWVQHTMRPDVNEPLLRSALEVLEDPQGACRSYAALYCAVARAAGIPCRIAVGALYVEDVLGGDAFAFHAWNEVWVGEWVAVDATLWSPGEPTPADATHIKFTEGDVRAFVPAARAIRSVGIEVLDADTMRKAEVDSKANQEGIVIR